jgi:hypothetical protein
VRSAARFRRTILKLYAVTMGVRAPHSSSIGGRRTSTLGLHKVIAIGVIDFERYTSVSAMPVHGAIESYLDRPTLYPK